MLAGSRSAGGIEAPLTSTGITGICRFNADSISMRTKSPWVLEPGLTLTAPFFHPVPSDHREEHLALGHLCVQMGTKINSKGNRIHILEDCLLAKLLDEPVVDPPGDIGAVLSTI